MVVAAVGAFDGLGHRRRHAGRERGVAGVGGGDRLRAGAGVGDLAGRLAAAVYRLGAAPGDHGAVVGEGHCAAARRRADRSRVGDRLPGDRRTARGRQRNGRIFSTGSSTTRLLKGSAAYASPAASTATPVGSTRPVNGRVTCWLKQAGSSTARLATGSAA